MPYKKIKVWIPGYYKYEKVYIPDKPKREYEFVLLNKKNIPTKIVISKEAKQDFKTFMGWGEEQFKKNTCRRFKDEQDDN